MTLQKIDPGYCIPLSENSPQTNCWLHQKNHLTHTPYCVRNAPLSDQQQINTTRGKYKLSRRDNWKTLVMVMQLQSTGAEVLSLACLLVAAVVMIMWHPVIGGRGPRVWVIKESLRCCHRWVAATAVASAPAAAVVEFKLGGRGRRDLGEGREGKVMAL